MQPVGDRLPALVHKPTPSYGTSRLSYRLQRFFLSRRWAVLSRYVIPSILVVYVVGRLFVLGVISDQVSAIKASIFNAVASISIFEIDRVEISGVEPELEARLLQALSFDLPISSLKVDLDAIRDGFADMDEIGSVSIRTPMNGALEIDVSKRVPVVVLINNGAVSALDIEGHRVEQLVARNERASLPVLAGIGAADAVREAVAIFRVAKPIWGDVRGLVRRGERRWDVILASGLRIELPSDNPVDAIKWVVAENELHDVFDRRVDVVDMREPMRPLVRLDPKYVEARLKELDDEQG